MSTEAGALRDGRSRGRAVGLAQSLRHPLWGVALAVLGASLTVAAGAFAAPGAHRRRGAHHAGRSRHGGTRAARPRRGARYSGSGADYLNNSTNWLKQGSGHISFKTSHSGRRVLDFRGTLSFSCEIGSSSVSAKYLKVSRAGSFAYRFNFPTRTSAGKVYGREYVAIYGHFLAHGRRASVGYFVDEVVKEKPVPHPYDTAHPRALGCSSWVQGTVTAR